MHLDLAVVEELRGRLRDDLLQPGDSAYDATRKVWNERLAQLESKYGPTHFFRMSNNIPPG